MPEVVVSGISSRFRGVSQCEGQVTHVLLTRSPLVYSRRSLTARLACVKHAASVRPEPGSNSPLKNSPAPKGRVNICLIPDNVTADVVTRTEVPMTSLSIVGIALAM